MSITKLQAAKEFQHILNEMEKISLDTVANRKKFQFAINQFRTFVESYTERANNTSLSPAQIEEYSKIVRVGREYLQLFSLNFIRSWAQTFLGSPTVSTATDLNTMTVRLYESASVLDPEAAKSFDASSPEWLQFHILDLRAIKESFDEYVKRAKPDDKIAPLMRNKLDSINNFFKEYSDKDIVHGVRIFSPIPIESQNWRLDHNDFACERKEGTGCSATVFYGHMKKSNTEVAIKQLKFPKLSGNKLRTFQREIMVLAMAEHPCLLKFVGATDTPPFCIVTEWMGGGTLFFDLHKAHKLNPTGLTIAAIDIARGMRFLHSRQLIHRDLKSLNVLLDAAGNAKICDFGFSRQHSKDQFMTQNIGTPHWMAPELLGGSVSYDEKIDVYAYGIVLWEILTRKAPYENLEPNQIIGQVLMSDLRPALPINTPIKIKELIERCWARDPASRPSFVEIVEIWREGETMLPGSDKEKIKQHLQESIEPSDRAKTNIETEFKSSDRTLRGYYSTLKRDGIPSLIVKKCWDNLESLHKMSTDGDTPQDQEDEIIYIRCLVMFLSTTLALNSSKTLRSLPKNSIPADISKSISMMIPTGNSKLDTDLVMIACKNNAAEEAVLHAVQNDHIMTALEIVARQETLTLTDDIVNKCVQCLSVDNINLRMACLRCLLAHNQAHRITIDALAANLQSRNTSLKMAAFVAAAKMADEKVRIPNELLDYFVEKSNTLPVAGTAIVNSCKNVDSAQYIFDRFMFGSYPPPDLAARIIIQIYNHESLRPILKSWLNQSMTSFVGTEAEEPLKIISSLLS